MVDVGKNIRKWRTERELTQKELAALVGCFQGSVHNWENNTHEIGVYQLMKVADALSVPVMWLMQ